MVMMVVVLQMLLLMLIAYCFCCCYPCCAVVWKVVLHTWDCSTHQGMITEDEINLESVFQQDLRRKLANQFVRLIVELNNAIFPLALSLEVCVSPSPFLYVILNTSTSVPPPRIFPIDTRKL